MTNFTREWHSGSALRIILLGALISLALVTWSMLSGVGAVSPAQQNGNPEANLPFLFAVFIITWAAFFVYVFYVSRRQREMQGEIEALKRALEERDRQASEQD